MRQPPHEYPMSWYDDPEWLAMVKALIEQIERDFLKAAERQGALV